MTRRKRQKGPFRAVRKSRRRMHFSATQVQQVMQFSEGVSRSEHPAEHSLYWKLHNAPENPDGSVDVGLTQGELQNLVTNFGDSRNALERKMGIRARRLVYRKVKRS